MSQSGQKRPPKCISPTDETNPEAHRVEDQVLPYGVVSPDSNGECKLSDISEEEEPTEDSCKHNGIDRDVETERPPEVMGHEASRHHDEATNNRAHEECPEEKEQQMNGVTVPEKQQYSENLSNAPGKQQFVENTSTVPEQQQLPMNGSIVSGQKKFLESLKIRCEPQQFAKNVSVDHKQQKFVENTSTVPEQQQLPKNGSIVPGQQKFLENLKIGRKPQQFAKNVSVDNKQQKVVENTSTVPERQQFPGNLADIPGQQHLVESTSVISEQKQSPENLSVVPEEQKLPGTSSTIHKQQQSPENPSVVPEVQQRPENPSVVPRQQEPPVCPRIIIRTPNGISEEAKHEVMKHCTAAVKKSWAWLHNQHHEDPIEPEEDIIRSSSSSGQSSDNQNRRGTGTETETTKSTSSNSYSAASPYQQNLQQYLRYQSQLPPPTFSATVNRFQSLERRLTESGFHGLRLYQQQISWQSVQISQESPRPFLHQQNSQNQIQMQQCQPSLPMSNPTLGQFVRPLHQHMSPPYQQQVPRGSLQIPNQSLNPPIISPQMNAARQGFTPQYNMNMFWQYNQRFPRNPSIIPGQQQLARYMPIDPRQQQLQGNATIIHERQQGPANRSIVPRQQQLSRNMPIIREAMRFPVRPPIVSKPYQFSEIPIPSIVTGLLPKNASAEVKREAQEYHRTAFEKCHELMAKEYNDDLIQSGIIDRREFPNNQSRRRTSSTALAVEFTTIISTVIQTTARWTTAALNTATLTTASPAAAGTITMTSGTRTSAAIEAFPPSYNWQPSVPSNITAMMGQRYQFSNQQNPRQQIPMHQSHPLPPTFDPTSNQSEDPSNLSLQRRLTSLRFLGQPLYQQAVFPWQIVDSLCDLFGPEIERATQLLSEPNASGLPPNPGQQSQSSPVPNDLSQLDPERGLALFLNSLDMFRQYMRVLVDLQDQREQREEDEEKRRWGELTKKR